jgi:hypothetical protein
MNNLFNFMRLTRTIADRSIRISMAEPPSPDTGGARPSASSAPSADQPKLIPANGFASQDLRTVGDGADGAPTAQPSESADQPKLIPANGFASQGLRTVGDGADGARNANGSTVRTNPLKTNGETDADDADANCPPRSAPEETGTPGWRMRL